MKAAPASSTGTPVSAHAALRAGTADDHATVDARFGTYDLADPRAYAAFLIAHARIVPALEPILAADAGLPRFASRTPLLLHDLAMLGRSPPACVPVTPPDTHAGRFGMLYVLEGSRLGGGMLARSVPEALPKGYLSAVHERGGWRAFLTALDSAADGAGWMADALAGARATFALFAGAGRDVHAT